MIEDGLVARLYASPDVVALIGPAGIYPVLLLKDAPMPALTFQRISSVTQNIFEASVSYRLVRARFQFSAWGGGTAGYSTALKLRRAVYASLLDFVGPLPDADATQVKEITADLAVDTFEDGPRYWRSLFDLIVWYLQAV